MAIFDEILRNTQAEAKEFVSSEKTCNICEDTNL